jgi:hypothetical protein
MQMLYNSDAFAVLRLDLPGDATGTATSPGAGDGARAGLEIVDKAGRCGIYLHGAVAESFLRGAQALAERSPDPDAFDDYIAGFAALGQQPLVLH